MAPGTGMPVSRSQRAFFEDALLGARRSSSRQPRPLKRDGTALQGPTVAELRRAGRLCAAFRFLRRGAAAGALRRLPGSVAVAVGVGPQRASQKCETAPSISPCSSFSASRAGFRADSRRPGAGRKKRHYPAARKRHCRSFSTANRIRAGQDCEHSGQCAFRRCERCHIPPLRQRSIRLGTGRPLCGWGKPPHRRARSALRYGG